MKEFTEDGAMMLSCCKDAPVEQQTEKHTLFFPVREIQTSRYTLKTNIQNGQEAVQSAAEAPACFSAVIFLIPLTGTE